MKPGPTKAGQKLPIDHPDYEYPHSRNPYSEKIIRLSKTSKAFADNDCEKHAGSWRQIFISAASSDTSSAFNNGAHITESRIPLIVEIGCNAGHVLVEWAHRNPEKLFLGIDWKYKPIVRAVEKSEKKSVKNTIFARLHATRLPFVFGESEIDELYVLFPDPWPKKSQRKNRLVQAPWLRKIAPLVKKEGIIHLRTDHADYFQTMREAFQEVRDIWTVKTENADLYASHPNRDSLKIPEVTLFERLFLNDGLPIHQIIAERI